MSVDQIMKNIQPKMDSVINNFQTDLKSIHTGRASSSLVEDIKVNHYNSLISLKEIASIATPSATLIIITPWDKGALQPIETAIREAGLNVNPQNDGSVIRLLLPPMSQERREELARLVKQKAESARIAIRTIREEAWKNIQKEEKDGEITEDDLYAGEKDLQALVAKMNQMIEENYKRKETEIMTI
jgi:ribosome recycling factor